MSGAHDVPLERRWAEAEGRLYATAATDDRRYERLVGLVRAVADALAACRTPEALRAAWDDAGRLVADVAQSAGVPLGPSDADAVAGAAFRLRGQEIAAAAAETAASQRIAAARAAGERWVVVAEHGRVEAAAVTGYHRVDLHLPDGRGIHTYAEPDIDADRAVYGLQVLRLDPDTGAVRDGDTDAHHTFTTRQDWQEAVDRTRDDIERQDVRAP